MDEAMSSQTRAKAKLSDYGDPTASPPKFPIMSAASVKAAARLIGRPDYSNAKKSTVIARIKRIANRKGYALPKSWAKGSSEAEPSLSDEEVRDALQDALWDDCDPDGDGDDDTNDPEDDYSEQSFASVSRVYRPDSLFVYSFHEPDDGDGDDDDGYYQRSFTLDANGEATLGSDIKRVRQVISFVDYQDSAESHQESAATAMMTALDNRSSTTPFDEAYLHKTIATHDSLIHASQKAVNEADHPELKKHAAGVIKDSQKHVDAARGMVMDWYGGVGSGESLDPLGEADGDADDMKPLGSSGNEAHHISFVESTTISEAFTDWTESDNATIKDGVITGTAIKPGFNRSGARYYPKETLKEAVPLFAGKKMFINHPSRFDEKNRPERSVLEMGAIIKEAWQAPDGSIKYHATLIHPELEGMLSLMKQRGVLAAMGTSVNYQGTAKKAEVDGRTTDYIEGFDALNSLDFVTEPGAWGDVASLESDGEIVPDVKGILTMDEATKAMFEAMKTELSEARAEAATERKERRISDARTAIKEALAESALPKVMKERVIAAYEGAENAEGIEQTIKDEETLFESLKADFGKPAKRENETVTRRPANRVVVGMGGKARTESDDDEGETVTDERFGESLDWLLGGKAQAKALRESYS